MKLPYLLSSYQYALRNRDARPRNSSSRFSQQNNFAIAGFMYFPDRLQLTEAGKCYLPCGYPPEKLQISDEAQMPKCSLDISHVHCVRSRSSIIFLIWTPVWAISSWRATICFTKRTGIPLLQRYQCLDDESHPPKEWWSCHPGVLPILDRAAGRYLQGS